MTDIETDTSFFENFDETDVNALPVLRILGSESMPTTIPYDVEYLDQLREVDPTSWSVVRDEVVGLLPEIIYGELGDKMLVWAAANADTKEQAGIFCDTLEELAGYDSELLGKVIRWSKDKQSSSRGTDVLAQYAVADTVMNGGLEFDLPSLLRDSARPDVEIGDKRANDYTLRPVKSLRKRAEGWIPETLVSVAPNTFYTVHLDTPTGFMVSYKGLPQAVVGLAASSPHEVMIYQMQGVLGKVFDAEHQNVLSTKSARGLAPLNWQKLLITIADRLGETIGAQSLGIQEGAQNSGTTTIHHGETEPHLSLETAVNAYDVPAQRAGFTRGADNNWHRPYALVDSLVV